jgi:hypothetical protein
LLPVCAAGIILAAAGPVHAQATIRYFDRAKKAEATLEADITAESPSQITYRLRSGRTDKLPAADVIDIAYRPPVGLSGLDYRKPTNKADEAYKATNDDVRKKAVQEAVALFKGLLPRLAEAKFAQRHMQFKLCQLLAWEAEQDPEQADAAIAELKKFREQHGDGWQIVAATKLLAGVLGRKGDVAAIQKAYEELAARDDIPPQTRQECDLLAAKALIDNDQPAPAEAKLRALSQKLAPDDPQAQRVQVLLAACLVARGELADAEKQLLGVLAKTDDPAVKAAAHNTLGDCYRGKGQPEEAFWQYLWVDVLYDVDHQEHARALYHLAKLFVQVKNDDARARQCRDRLLKDKQFAGMDYQARVLRAEKQ